MTLDEITLFNFGVYAGRQTISLTPTSSERPVVLLGGLNGGGKTTFLDALQLCLFGPHARISNRGSLAYTEYLNRSIHRGAENSKASIEIGFRHTVEGREDRYSLRRSWRRTNGSCKEKFEVWKDGRKEPALADNWATQVEDFLPPNIAHLFLFDGEQIEGYASHEHSSALIGTAIQNLLGLDMVDQLEKDLQVYERRKRSETGDDSVLTEVNAAEAELCRLQDRVDELCQERASLKTYQIDRKRKDLDKIENDYRKLGGDLYDQRLDIERRLDEVNKAIHEGNEAHRELAAGVLPLVLVKVLLESIERRDRHEEECRRARELSDVLQVRDQVALDNLRAKTADKDTITALKSFFDEDRAKRRTLGMEETILDLSPEVRSDLNNLLRDGLDEVVAVAKRRLRQQKENESSAVHVHLEFDSIPSRDAVAELSAQRDILKKEVGALEVGYTSLSSEIDRLRKEIDRKKQALARLYEAEATASADSDDRERLLRHVAKVRMTLGDFRHAVVGRHVRRIEQLVFESYQQLLRKESLVTRLSIDPKLFAITLFGRDGKILTAERLSAGERQLLAIAILWGLPKRQVALCRQQSIRRSVASMPATGCILSSDTCRSPVIKSCCFPPTKRSLATISITLGHGSTGVTI